MGDLVILKNKQVVTSSRQVAEVFEKRHSDVVRAIENKIENLTSQNCEVKNMFYQTNYSHRGNTYKEYLLNRDGFSFIVMGFTGAKADQWKLKYIEAFNKMEETIKTKALSPMDQLRLQYEVLDDHDERLKMLEDTMNINYGQQQELQNKVKSIAVRMLGGINSQAYKNNSIRGKVFAAIWRDYKDYMGVGSYRDTPRKDLKKGIEFLENWQPAGGLLRNIEDLNERALEIA